MRLGSFWSRMAVRAQQSRSGLLGGPQLLVDPRQIGFLAGLEPHADELCPHGRVLPEMIAATSVAQPPARRLGHLSYDVHVVPGGGVTPCTRYVWTSSRTHAL